MTVIDTSETIDRDLKHDEAVLTDRIDRAVGAGRLNRESPTFTSRGLATAIRGLPEVMSPQNEREIDSHSARMGVFLILRHSRRKTPDLLEALPEWIGAARKELARA